MLKHRLIAVLILREGRVVQSVKFKHTNVIHYDPVHAIECFNRWAVDEIVVLDVSPTPATREAFADTIKAISRKCFVPISAGGWITDADHARRLLQSGADKLVVNSAWHRDPELVTALSNRYGRQCIVASMDVVPATLSELGRVPADVAIDRAKVRLGVDPVEWARTVERLGAGEIFFNSVTHDGSRKGYCLDELRRVCGAVSIPVIAFGGVFTWDHLVQGLEAGASAVAAANIFHYTEHSTRKAKRFLKDAGVAVRFDDAADPMTTAAPTKRVSNL